MKRKLFRATLALLFSFILMTANAQPGGGGPNPCPPTDPNYPDCDPVRVPITGSILILLAGGLALGLRTVTKKEKNHQQGFQQGR
jgi:hypothetical protein